MTREQLFEYTKMIAQGKDSKKATEALRKKSGLVKDTPAAFGSWIKDNKKRVAGWKNKPFWYQDNAKFVKGRR